MASRSRYASARRAIGSRWTLRARLLAPFAAGVIALVLVVVAVFTVVAERGADEELTRSASGVERLFRDQVSRRQVQMESDAAVIASQDGFETALSGDRRALSMLAVDNRIQQDYDYIAASGPGSSRTFANRRVGWGSLIAGAATVQRARQGIASGGVGVVDSGEPVHVVAVPTAVPGKEFGVVILGQVMGPQPFEEIGGALDRGVWLETAVGGRAATLGRPATQGQHTRTYSFPVALSVDSPGEARLKVSMSTERLSAATRSALVHAAGIGLVIALLVIVLVTVLLERAVMRPLRSVRGAIRRVGEGDYAARLPLDGPKELRELAEGFNSAAHTVGEQRERLEALAGTDPLTGLANNRRFHETLELELERARRERSEMALVLIDIDHFKELNDAHRHPFGDEVLRSVARELLGAVRATDLVARVGGEEFAIVVTGADAELALRVAERARAAASQIPLPGAAVSCSAGLACFPQDAADARMLIAEADRALYAAKRRGRSHTRRYEAGDSTSSYTEEQYTEVMELLERSDAIKPVFQPLVDLATGRVVGFEALSRFDTPAGRPPDQWFAQAHRCGLGPELEAKAVAAALAVGDRPAGTFLCLNLSPTALSSAVVADVLPEDMHGLVVEITEQEMVSDADALAEILGELRARGAKIALDDAGAGYAGLQQVMRLELDTIKLDRSIVDGVHGDLAKLALIESFVRFARRTGAAVCAEGIETLDDLTVLADLDVTYGQGYALARPSEPWANVSPAISEALFARSVGRQGGGLVNAGLAETGDRRLEQLTARISTVTSLDELEELYGVIGDEVGAEEICFSTWHPDGGYVQTISDLGWVSNGQRFHVAGYPSTEHVLRTQESVQILADDPRADAVEVELLASGGHRSLLMVPVVSRGATVGLLECCRAEERPWARSDVNRARIIGYQLGHLLESLAADKAPMLTVLPGGKAEGLASEAGPYSFRGSGL